MIEDQKLSLNTYRRSKLLLFAYFLFVSTSPVHEPTRLSCN